MSNDWDSMDEDMKINILNNTIDDLRDIKVEQGRAIARLERQLGAALSANGALSERIDALEAQNAAYAKAFEEDKVPLAEFLVGKMEASREVCEEFLASVDESRKAAKGDGSES